MTGQPAKTIAKPKKPKNQSTPSRKPKNHRKNQKNQKNHRSQTDLGPDLVQGALAGYGPICLKSFVFLVFFVFPMFFLVFWRGGFGFFGFFGFSMCSCINGCLGAVRVFVCRYVSDSLCQLQASMGTPRGPSLQSLAGLTLHQMGLHRPYKIPGDVERGL